MEIGDCHWVFDGHARPFVGGSAVHKAFLRTAAEQHDGGATGEVAVLAIVVGLLQKILRGIGLVVGLRSGLAFHDHVAAKLAGNNDERSLKQAAGFQIADQGCNRSVDHCVQLRHCCMAPVVRIPVNKRNVFSRHLNVAGTVFNEPPSQQTAAAEATGFPPHVVLRLHILGLLRDVEGIAFLGA